MKIKGALDEIDHELHVKAKEQLNASIHDISNISEIQEGHILKTAFCGEESCRLAIEKPGVEMVGLSVEEDSTTGRCIVCGRETTESAYIASTY